MYNPNPDDSQRLRVLRAAASCPVQAIIVDQLDDGEPRRPSVIQGPKKDRASYKPFLTH
jgi:hypothetical protein